jgi:hypothetical protein
MAGYECECHNCGGWDPGLDDAPDPDPGGLCFCVEMTPAEVFERLRDAMRPMIQGSHIVTLDQP